MTPYDQAVRRVDKPWGYELHFALTDRYCGKILFVRAGESLSLQYHETKDETLYLQSGRADVELGSSSGSLELIDARPGAAFHLTPRTVHRITAVDDSTFLEVSTPELEDVVRLEDRYGRVPAAPTDLPA
jgi:mannose-6-phosphate isomerase-like protein (cupin superfamily)